MKMDCPECVFKHLLEAEHHLKDLVTVDKRNRHFWQRITDQVRSSRKQTFEYIVKNPSCIECSGKPRKIH